MNFAGYRNGPLKWRANGGADWSTKQLTVGANLQYFGKYSILLPSADPESQAELNADAIQAQGSRWIPSQWYLDLHGAWQLPVRGVAPVNDLAVDFGIVNVLDRSPPRESTYVFAGPGFSRYGDPRQRRFELGLSAHF